MDLPNSIASTNIDRAERRRTVRNTLMMDDSGNVSEASHFVNNNNNNNNNNSNNNNNGPGDRSSLRRPRTMVIVNEDNDFDEPGVVYELAGTDS